MSDDKKPKQSYINVSGLRLADDQGKDWFSDDVRAIDPTHRSMRPLIDAGKILPVTAKPQPVPAPAVTGKAGKAAPAPAPASPELEKGVEQ